MYDEMKKQGSSIGDLQLAIDFSLKELKTDSYFASKVWAVLSTTDSIREASDIVCRVYENPEVKNYDPRYNAAVFLRANYAGHMDGDDDPHDPDPEPVLDPEPHEPDTPTTPYWPPRMLCEGMQGADVSVLQAILQAQDYNTEITGIFDNRTKAMVLAFQGENELSTDGVAGPKTFRALGVSV